MPVKSTVPRAWRRTVTQIRWPVPLVSWGCPWPRSSWRRSRSWCKSTTPKLARWWWKFGPRSCALGSPTRTPSDSLRRARRKFRCCPCGTSAGKFCCSRETCRTPSRSIETRRASQARRRAVWKFQITQLVKRKSTKFVKNIYFKLGVSV